MSIFATAALERLPSRCQPSCQQLKAVFAKETHEKGCTLQGKWLVLLVVGCWLLVVGCWLLVVGVGIGVGISGGLPVALCFPLRGRLAALWGRVPDHAPLRQFIFFRFFINAASTLSEIKKHF